MVGSPLGHCVSTEVLTVHLGRDLSQWLALRLAIALSKPDASVQMWRFSQWLALRLAIAFSPTAPLGVERRSPRSGWLSAWPLRWFHAVRQIIRITCLAVVGSPLGHCVRFFLSQTRHFCFVSQWLALRLAIALSGDQVSLLKFLQLAVVGSPLGHCVASKPAAIKARSALAVVGSPLGHCVSCQPLLGVYPSV